MGSGAIAKRLIKECYYETVPIVADSVVRFISSARALREVAGRADVVKTCKRRGGRTRTEC